MQLELPELAVTNTINQLPFGKAFRFERSGQIHIRVKPVNYLLNSTLLTDVINRGKCIVSNVEKGTVYVVEGDREVMVVDAVIRIKSLKEKV